MTTANKAVVKAKEKLALTSPVVTLQQQIERSVVELGKALPSHMSAERLGRIAITALKSTPKLNEVEPRSMLAAVFQCASVGLEPIDGQAWIIPYAGKAQFQMGYKGYIELYWRHDRSVLLQMEAVHQNDRFEFDYGRDHISHIPAPFSNDRGKVVCYYAKSRVQGSTVPLFKIMSVTEILAHAKRFSKCWDKNKNDFMSGTPWKNDFDAMAKKTVLIQLMKVLPKSVEIHRALAMDETVKSGVAVDMLEVPNEAVYEDTPETGQKSEAQTSPTQEQTNKYEAFKQAVENDTTQADLVTTFQRIEMARDTGNLTLEQYTKLGELVDKRQKELQVK